ncbi:TRAP transporter small permease [Marinibacterium sp. SX1]|uniref:TRAP transporter small permease n=1 Tax=Marinibacterium sp. SX1 TaxID=3388424 RepID=UPI003D17CDA8
MSLLHSRVLRHAEEVVAGLALLVLIGSVCWGVVTRYVSQTSAAWVGDISSVAFAWLIFMGAAAAFRHGMHMSIDLVWRLLPSALGRWLGAAVDVLVLAFLVYATWLGVGFCLASMDDPLPILRWPRAVLYAAVMTGFACMALRYAALSWSRWRGGHTPDGQDGDQTDDKTDGADAWA